MSDRSTVSSELQSWYGFDHLIRIQKAVGDDLVAQYDRVVGTGVGLKLVHGESTGEPAIILFVREKVNRSDPTRLASDQLVPQSLSGAPVDVIEVGDLVKHTGYVRRTRPIYPGYSISHKKVTAGTLAGLFMDRDGDIVALSNNHVLADENRAELNDPIYQPGLADMAPGTDMTWIDWKRPIQNLAYFATLKHYVKLQPGGAINFQDSAIAKIPTEYAAVRMLNPNYPNGRPLVGFGMATPGIQVQKFGRTSGHTRGKVLAISAKFTIGYDIGQITFDDCIVCTSMTRGGDSGSLLLNEEMYAVGLLFAGSDKVSLFHPIERVREEYGLEIWRPDGDEPTMELWGRHWKQFGCELRTNQRGVLLCEARANQHCFIDTPIDQDLAEVSCDVFSGTDQCTEWGPGLAVTFPNGVLRFGIRRGHGFATTWQGKEYLAGRSEGSRWYTLRLRLGADWIVAEATDKTAKNDRWTKVVEIPTNTFVDPPATLRVGKMSADGTAEDALDPGPTGSCQFSVLTIKPK